MTSRIWRQRRIFVSAVSNESANWRRRRYLISFLNISFWAFENLARLHEHNRYTVIIIRFPVHISKRIKSAKFDVVDTLILIKVSRTPKCVGVEWNAMRVENWISRAISVAQNCFNWNTTRKAFSVHENQIGFFAISTSTRVWLKMPSARKWDLDRK